MPLKYVPVSKFEMRRNNPKLGALVNASPSSKKRFLLALGLDPEQFKVSAETSTYSTGIWFNVYRMPSGAFSFCLHLGFRDVYSASGSRHLGNEWYAVVSPESGLTGYRDSLEDSLISLDFQPFLDMFEGAAFDGDKAWDFLENGLGAAFKSVFRPEPKRGLVKTFYVCDNEDVWLYKRANSDKIMCFDGKYYLKRCLTPVVDEAGVDSFVHPRTLNGSDHNYVFYGTKWYHKNNLCPIYHNSVPFNTVHSWVPLVTAERGYEYIEINGERRYLNVPIERAGIFSKSLHSYTTRIESLVEPKHLFLMGKRDLYAYRDKDEIPYLGWELEACCDKSEVGRSTTCDIFKEQLPNLVMCKQDGSIAPEGFEVVSVPATLDAWKETDIFNALDVMRSAPYNMRSFEHSSCGFHVHVSRKALSILDLQKIERFMNNPDNRQFLCDVAGRKATTYANYNDKYFTDRKSFSKNRTRSSRVVRRDYHEDCGLMWFDQPQNILSQLPRPTTVDDENYLYGFLNDHVAFRTIRDVSVSVYSNLGSFMAVRNDVLNLCRISPLFAHVVSVYLPSIREEVEAILDEIGRLDRNNVEEKQKYKAGRKYSYEESQKMPFLVGKLDGRYGVLNTSNRNTIEFRLFKGTMNPASIMRYLEFVDAIVRYVPSASASNEGLNYSLFLNWLVNDPFNVVRYEHLVSFLIDKGYLVRTAVRKRDIVSGAGDTDGTPSGVAVAKRLNNDSENRPPLMRINTSDPLPEPVTNSVGLVVTYEDDEFYEEEDYDEDEFCECDDCRAARGEI